MDDCEYTGRVVRIVDHPTDSRAKCLLVKLEDDSQVVYSWGKLKDYPILNALQYADKVSFSVDPHNEAKLTELVVLDVE